MARLQEQAKAFIVSSKRRTREIEEAEERIKRLKQEAAVPFSVNGQVTDPFTFVTEPIEEQLTNSPNPPRDRTRAVPYSVVARKASQEERDEARRTARTIRNRGRSAYSASPDTEDEAWTSQSRRELARRAERDFKKALNEFYVDGVKIEKLIEVRCP
jgi:hypothetical protein